LVEGVVDRIQKGLSVFAPPAFRPCGQVDHHHVAAARQRVVR
jgi:hypothetical protein